MSAAHPDIELSAIATLWDCLHKTPSYSEDGYPMVRVTDIKRGFLDVSGTLKVNDETYQEFIRRYKPKPGDILLTRVGTYGNSCYVGRDHDFCLGQNTVCIAPDHRKTVPYFLYCCFNMPSVKQQIDSFVGGASQPTISLRNILLLKIPLPDIAVQRKIAAVLSAYDELIENNLRRIKILEEMAQNLYREWFVKFRFPGHQKFRFTDSPLGKIPEGWEVANLLDITVVKYGKNLPTKNLVSDGDYPVYGAAKIIGRHTEYTREERTIITGCRGSVGEMQITLPKCFVTNNSFTFDVQQRIDFFWLFHSLKERGFADVIGGAAQPQITLDGLSKVQILVPLKAIRALFHDHAENTFSLLWNLEGRNTILRRTRDLLLPRLISGEVDVSALDIAVPEEASA